METLSSERSVRGVMSKERSSFDMGTVDPLMISTDQAELDALLEKFENQDVIQQKTWSRRLVENYLSKYKWYNPQRDDPDAPKLEHGWVYYEHITLPRRLVRPDGHRR